MSITYEAKRASPKLPHRGVLDRIQPMHLAGSSAEAYRVSQGKLISLWW